jgi:hypothetical protein
MLRCCTMCQVYVCVACVPGGVADRVRVARVAQHRRQPRRTAGAHISARARVCVCVRAWECCACVFVTCGAWLGVEWDGQGHDGDETHRAAPQCGAHTHAHTHAHFSPRIRAHTLIAQLSAAWPTTAQYAAAGAGRCSGAMQSAHARVPLCCDDRNGSLCRARGPTAMCSAHSRCWPPPKQSARVVATALGWGALRAPFGFGFVRLCNRLFLLRERSAVQRLRPRSMANLAGSVLPSRAACCMLRRCRARRRERQAAERRAADVGQDRRTHVHVRPAWY